MPDDLTHRQPEDRKKINVEQPSEMTYWSTELRVSVETLRAAVRRVGPLVADVRRHLGK